MNSFGQIHNFINFLEKRTCYKNPTNPSFDDRTITNKPRSFQISCTFETGLSDFHKITLTVLKSSLGKQKPKVLNYRNYKFFNNTQIYNCDKELKHFKETCLSVLNTVAPLKSRFIRANQAPFINKKILSSGQN